MPSDVAIATSPERSQAAQNATFIGGMRVDAGTYESTTQRIINWAGRAESRYVCIANVHMVMEAHDSISFRHLVNAADIVTSDGMPLVWVLRRRELKFARRVYGPDLMLHTCAAAAESGVPVAMFGGTPEVMSKMCDALLARYPSLDIVSRIVPPFGSFTDDSKNRAFIREIKDSGARIVFIGLGCPKQERWMAAVSKEIPAVLLGVGAAFNFHAGKVRQSPAWMQRLGLEWAFRFAMEPRRLWKRYCWHNPRFIWTVFKEEFSRAFRSSGRLA